MHLLFNGQGKKANSGRNVTDVSRQQAAKSGATGTGPVQAKMS
jgi:hypothetical protein